MCFRKSLLNKTNERINQLITTSELATTEYTIVKVIKADDHPSLFKAQIGDRKILYSCKIYVKAGMDLKKYNSSLTEINEATKTITLTLPHAQLLSFNMPAEEQDLVYEKVGKLRRDFSHYEKNELLIQGEESVKNTIQDVGILADAERNASDFFRNTLLQLGYSHVNIKFENN